MVLKKWLRLKSAKSRFWFFGTEGVNFSRGGEESGEIRTFAGFHFRAFAFTRLPVLRELGLMGCVRVKKKRDAIRSVMRVMQLVHLPRTLPRHELVSAGTYHSHPTTQTYDKRRH